MRTFKLKICFLFAVCSGPAIGCAHFDITVPPNPVLQRADVNGVPTLAVLPRSYDSRKATPWIIYNHGFGEPIHSIVTIAPEAGFVHSLAAAGFVVVASEYRDLACWGNMDCAEDIANLQTLWRSQLNLSPQPFVVGISMGGIVTWNAISRGTLKPLAAVGIYPACNLAAMYSNPVFAPTIETAFDFTSPGGYSAATTGFDPMLAPASIFAGVPIQIWASHSDHVVVRSQNEDPFALAINAVGGNVTIHTSHGEHGDASNFDSQAVVSFFSARLL